MFSLKGSTLPPFEMATRWIWRMFALNAVAAPSPEHLLNLALLAILPTIGGFWCTTKALTC